MQNKFKQFLPERVDFLPVLVKNAEPNFLKIHNISYLKNATLAWPVYQFGKISINYWNNNTKKVLRESVMFLPEKKLYSCKKLLDLCLI